MEADMGVAVAWTAVIIMWHGQTYQLQPKPVENLLQCNLAGEVQVIEWAQAHHAEDYRIVRWGCTKEPGYST
jgi:hypothetical protein